MLIRVEVFQTKSDGLWHLQAFDLTNDRVLMLLTRRRLIEVLDAATVLQIHIDNADDLPIRAIA
jgi:hypothetical protein